MLLGIVPRDNNPPNTKVLIRTSAFSLISSIRFRIEKYELIRTTDGLFILQKVRVMTEYFSNFMPISPILRLAQNGNFFPILRIRLPRPRELRLFQFKAKYL